MSDTALISFSLGLLTALLVGTNGFWIYVTLELHNRLMSRSYGEFTQGERLKKPAAVETRTSEDAVQDSYAQENANKANSLFLG